MTLAFVTRLVCQKMTRSVPLFRVTCMIIENLRIRTFLEQRSILYAYYLHNWVLALNHNVPSLKDCPEPP